MVPEGGQPTVAAFGPSEADLGLFGGVSADYLVKAPLKSPIQA
jgi:hypothetical protein